MWEGIGFEKSYFFFFLVICITDTEPDFTEYV